MVYHAPHLWGTSGGKVTFKPQESTLVCTACLHAASLSPLSWLSPLPLLSPHNLAGDEQLCRKSLCRCPSGRGLALTAPDGVVLSSVGDTTDTRCRSGICCSAAVTNKIATALVPPTEACVD